MIVYVILSMTHVTTEVFEVYSSFELASKRVDQIRSEVEDKWSVEYEIITVPLLSKLPF